MRRLLARKYIEIPNRDNLYEITELGKQATRLSIVTDEGYKLKHEEDFIGAQRNGIIATVFVAILTFIIVLWQADTAHKEYQLKMQQLQNEKTK